MNNNILDVEKLSKMNAFACLWESCKDHLNEVAITYKADNNVKDYGKKVPTTFITYSDLIKNILKTYENLKNMGVKAGDTITFSTINTPELVYTMYASVILGSIIDTIDPRMKENELIEHFKVEPSKVFFVPEKMFDNVENIYKDINVDKIITLSFMESLPKPVKLAAKLMDVKNKTLFKSPDKKLITSWERFDVNNTRTVSVEDCFEKKDPISFAHTTGTTGKSKTLVHINDNWNAQFYNISTSGLVFKRGETFFNNTAPWVDFGLINSIHAFLCNGIRLDFDPLWTPELTVDYYLKNRPSWWLGAPGWIDPLFTFDEYKDASLDFGRYIITGGAPLFYHKQRLYNDTLKEKNSPAQVVPGYGLSEVTAAAFLDLEDDAISLGNPLPAIDYKIVNPDTTERVKDGESGELWIKAKYEELSPMAVGYLNNEKETNATFVYDDGSRWVRTGDKVFLNENGRVVWESRYKNILTFNGFNINCDKLIDTIEDMDFIYRCGIVGAVTGDGNQRPIICVQANPDYNISNDEIKNYICEYIEKKFPEYYEPLDVVVYDELPVKSMKIDYNTLKGELLNENGEYKVEVLARKR